MNEHEAQRIAAAANRLRPDWPEAQLMTLITDKLMDRPRRDVAVALAWVACDTSTATPYRVLEAGPWWKAVGGFSDEGRAPRPPKPHEACRDCGRHFDACLCDGGPTITPHLPAPDPSAKVARLKAIRDEVAGGCCSCGPNCLTHRPTREGDHDA